MTDINGTTVNSYTYDSFGNHVQRMELVSNPFTYTGREYDAESGLYYHRARYYDSNTGRFLSEDPVAGNRNIPTTLNKYIYAQNNPTNKIDPLGLMGCDYEKKRRDSEKGLLGPRFESGNFYSRDEDSRRREEYRTSTGTVVNADSKFRVDTSHQSQPGQGQRQ